MKKTPLVNYEGILNSLGRLYLLANMGKNNEKKISEIRDNAFNLLTDLRSEDKHTVISWPPSYVYPEIAFLSDKNTKYIEKIAGSSPKKYKLTENGRKQAIGELADLKKFISELNEHIAAMENELSTETGDK